MSDNNKQKDEGGKKPDVLNGAPCERALQRLEEAVSVLQAAYGEQAPPAQLFTDLLMKGARVSTHVNQYIDARRDELETPYLNKDFPRVDKETQMPQRASAEKDKVHQAEHQISLAMHAILNDVQKLPRTQEAEAPYKQLLGAVRDLADVLTVMGIFLDQGTHYAYPGTLPKAGEGDALVPSKPLAHHAFFTRLNKLSPPPRVRGVE